MKKQTLKRSGFTLIEVLVVATIISILAASGLVSYSSFIKKSRDERRKLDLENIRSALEMYRSDYGYYPTSLNDSTFKDTYLKEIPKDPTTGQEYSYQSLPNGCNNLMTYCTDYVIGAIIENTDQTTNCNDMLPNACKINSSQNANCNYCLGPYGER